MKIALPFEFKQEPKLFLQRAGYHELNDINSGQNSFVRRLHGDYYPRFHIYQETDSNGRKFINLHLDQKKPSYSGAHADNAEYDGEVIQKETERLQGLIKNQMDNQNQVKTEPVAKNFWHKLFNS
jgi:hypothetical protein